MKEPKPEIMSQPERDGILTFIAVKAEKLTKNVVALCIFNGVIVILQTLLIILSLKQ